MRHRVFTVILVAVILVLGFFRFPELQFRLVYAADSQGNDINFVELYQWNGSEWYFTNNFSASGQSCRIHDSWETRFNVSIKYNSSLVSGTYELGLYSNVMANLTIIGGATIWTNQNFTRVETLGPIGGFYYCKFQGDWNATLPVQGFSYNCTIDYQASY